jgi:hypothetical protein
MKKAALIFLVSLFISTVSAVNYEASLIGDELEHNFDISGWAESENPDRTKIGLKYDLKFVNEKYNHTEVNYFTVRMIDGSHVVAAKNLSVSKLGSKSGLTTVSSENSPDRITAIEFISNHTKYKESRSSTNTFSSARAEYEPTKRHPEINKLETSTSVTYRDQKVKIKAYTEEIQNLSVNGKQMRERDEYFSTKLSIPVDVDAGENVLEYGFRSGSGSKFTKNFSITVNNRAPEINLTVDREVPKGDKISVKADISDDWKIVNQSLRFRNELFKLKSGKTEIPTTYLYAGNYTLEMRAVDSDGAYTTETRSIKVYTNTTSGKDQKQNSTSKNNSKADNSSADGKTKTEKSSKDSENEQESKITGEDEEKNSSGFRSQIIEPVITFFKELSKMI